MEEYSVDFMTKILNDIYGFGEYIRDTSTLLYKNEPEKLKETRDEILQIENFLNESNRHVESIKTMDFMLQQSPMYFFS